MCLLAGLFSTGDGVDGEDFSGLAFHGQLNGAAADWAILDGGVTGLGSVDHGGVSFPAIRAKDGTFCQQLHLLQGRFIWGLWQ
jgi:hypothetical protein